MLWLEMCEVFAEYQKKRHQILKDSDKGRCVRARSLRQDSSLATESVESVGDIRDEQLCIVSVLLVLKVVSSNDGTDR